MAQVIKPPYTPRYVPSGEEVAVIETAKGTIRAKLNGKTAPVTVGNFIELASKGFYDNLNFYNRKEGDVVVGGCPITRSLRPQEVRMAVREQIRGVHPGMGDEMKSISIEGVHEMPDDSLIPETVIVSDEDGEHEVANPDFEAMRALEHLLNKKATK